MLLELFSVLLSSTACVTSAGGETINKLSICATVMFLTTTGLTGALEIVDTIVA